MFKTRLLSGILLVIIALATIISGGDVLFATLLMISFIGMTEAYRVLQISGTLLGGVGYVAAAVYYLLLRMNRTDMVVMLAIAFLIVLMMVYVFTYPKYRSEQVMLAFFGLFYVAFMLSYVYQIRMLPQGAFIVWLVFICSWGSDTCAYCVGMLIGKHKMAPKLSPKKSIEGAVGGVVGAALLGAAYAAIMNRTMAGADAGVIQYALIGAVGALISMVGDLAASAIKRNHDIKDYGNLIPGHGGILDRFDSVIFTAPIIYYMAVMLL
jgi:phosphatidate cytidylyltransferase